MKSYKCTLQIPINGNRMTLDPIESCLSCLKYCTTHYVFYLNQSNTEMFICRLYATKLEQYLRILNDFFSTPRKLYRIMLTTNFEFIYSTISKCGTWHFNPGNNLTKFSGENKLFFSYTLLGELITDYDVTYCRLYLFFGKWQIPLIT